jgi:hypothetical protein
MCYWEVQFACLIENLARCIVQSVLIVVANVKLHSNLTRADQFTVEIVGQNEDKQIVSVTRRLSERVVSTFPFPHFLKPTLCSITFSSLLYQKCMFQMTQVASWIKVIR